ncbi:altered inheritance of mitochondria protein 21-like [Amborella trichopoda]|uniref:altered inheritance of mitochondria protein 21-like n=1 Tax=Amborella trichopoda TaxID=13333 RepID=UPI0005D37AAD|nr:altered inheritance of mitochondria protein 21-like [Amborella trichopoda]|eukprot:XP_011629418.1 altered inheritance of mitochondria protein 21-like [Amborella trichopoda]
MEKKTGSLFDNLTSIFQWREGRKVLGHEGRPIQDLNTLIGSGPHSALTAGSSREGSSKATAPSSVGGKKRKSYAPISTYAPTRAVKPAPKRRSEKISVILESGGSSSSSISSSFTPPFESPFALSPSFTSPELFSTSLETAVDEPSPPKPIVIDSDQEVTPELEVMPLSQRVTPESDPVPMEINGVEGTTVIAQGEKPDTNRTSDPQEVAALTETGAVVMDNEGPSIFQEEGPMVSEAPEHPEAAAPKCAGHEDEGVERFVIEVLAVGDADQVEEVAAEIVGHMEEIAPELVEAELTVQEGEEQRRDAGLKIIEAMAEGERQGEEVVLEHAETGVVVSANEGQGEEAGIEETNAEGIEQPKIGAPFEFEEPESLVFMIAPE